MDESKSTYTFKYADTNNYLNSYSETNTGLWTDGAGDPNNLWKVEEVTTVSVAVPAYGYVAACYPFALSLADGVTAYTVSEKATYNYQGTNFEYAVLEKLSGNTIPAYMPVIISAAAGTYSLEITSDPDNVEVATNLLKGATLKKTLTKGEFLSTLTAVSVAGTTASLNASSTATQVQPNKSYLLKEEVGGATQLYLGQKEILTSIDSIEADDENHIFYNLDGTRALNLKKGCIYVTSEGKKILVK